MKSKASDDNNGLILGTDGNSLIGNNYLLRQLPSADAVQTVRDVCGLQAQVSAVAELGVAAMPGGKRQLICRACYPDRETRHVGLQCHLADQVANEKLMIVAVDYPRNGNSCYQAG